MRITTPDAASELAGLPLEATVAMADVAGAMREGLLAFSTAAGLVVMQQMLATELASIVGAKHAKLGPERSRSSSNGPTDPKNLAKSSRDNSTTNTLHRAPN